ncbi:secretion pathway protein Sls2/Rcy1 [Stemphylium lycopersici]|uniref:Secretion pathway protein Sls2/Rcy1 n=1 Tax=Stemphylium lycopersici TaxID=183478 RepID=A0A364NFM2_STELY|nr:secretion pathway protein Sls2/Rcy1 [Stemphylium lycopersici]
MATKSNFKRAVPQSQPSIMASLRTTQLVGDSKAVLPAELINAILDYLPVADMFSFARTSKRMREMVYDDTRWQQRLRSMGCWNEAEAKQRFEEAMRKKLEAQRAEDARRAGVALNGSTNGMPPGDDHVGKTSMTLFDATIEEDMLRSSQEHQSRPRSTTLDKGFNDMTLSASGTLALSSHIVDPQAAAKVLANVRSIRGMARQEYGKVYGALAPFYYDIERSRSHTDPILFRTYRDPEQQAQMLAQLKVFAKSDYAQGWGQREEKLDTMTGIFENAVLREFETGYAEKDFDGRMKRFASVLVTLNGGAACLDSFIHNHPLMLEKEKLGDPSDCLRNDSVTLEPSHNFFRGLAMSLNEEAALIDRVFPPTFDVLQAFIERVADDVIAEYLTTLFDEAHDVSIEAYLKVVAGVFEQALQLAISLHPTKASKSDFKDEAMRIITRCFEPHVDLYLQEELDFFKRRSAAEVDLWEKRLIEEEQTTETLYMANVNRKAVKQDFLSSFKKVVMMPVNVLPTIGGSGASKPAETTVGANRSSTFEPTSRSGTPGPGDRSSTPRIEAPTTELAAKAAIMNSRLEGIRSLFSIEVALNLTHMAKSGLERAARFVRLGGQSGEEAKEQSEQIFINLVQILGNRHMKLGFDKAVNHLADYKPREVADHSKEGVAPLVAFLELVNVGDLIQQMVEVFYLQELVAANLTERDDFLSLAAKEKKRFEAMLDERVAAGLNKGIDVLMDEVEYLCGTTQLPSDFNPPVGPNGVAEISDIGPSQTATKIVEVVSSHTSMLIGSTDKNVLDVFNQEVGVRLFTALCKHLKRQRISVDGAIKLISDMNAYNAYIVSLRNKPLMQYFAALRELSQIYLIDAKQAKEIATIIADTDRYHGIFRAEEVYEFAERRADWYQIKSAVEKQMPIAATAFLIATRRFPDFAAMSAEPLPAEVEASYSLIIDEILRASDINTISAKRIRKGLQERVDNDLSQQKDQITTLIMQRFDKFNSEQNGGSEVSEPIPTVENGAKTCNGDTSDMSNHKRSPPDDESALSEVDDIPPPKKKTKKTKTKDEDDDAAFAARLQAEENARMGRATRGGNTKRKAPAPKKKTKKKSANRVKDEDDSDLGSGSGGEKKSPSRKGGFHKPMALSPALSELLGETQLSRPQTVKKIWEYVKARDLQDPSDKRQIRCDDAMRAVFKQDRVHMFTMNKILNQNLYAVDEVVN